MLAYFSWTVNWKLAASTTTIDIGSLRTTTTHIALCSHFSAAPSCRASRVCSTTTSTGLRGQSRHVATFNQFVNRKFKESLPRAPAPHPQTGGKTLRLMKENCLLGAAALKLNVSPDKDDVNRALRRELQPEVQTDGGAPLCVRALIRFSKR